jgi:hypothetical protein
MALEATFRELTTCFHKVNDVVNALQITIEDKPEHDEAALADGLENTVLDIMGALHEARRAALHARQATGHPLDLDSARRALSVCQDRFHRIEQEYAANLVSYEKLRELARLSSERRGEWRLWAESVKQGVEQCQPPLHGASKALAGCWQELVEHGGKTSISIRTENLGQKIFAQGTRDAVGSSST